MTVVEVQRTAVDLLEAAFDLDTAAPQLTANAPDLPLPTETLKVAGDQALTAGDHERAVDIYERVIAVEPSNHEASNNLGIALLALQRYRHAQRVLHARLGRRRGIPSEYGAAFDPLRPVSREPHEFIAGPARLRDTADQLQYLVAERLLDTSFRDLAARYLEAAEALARDPSRKPYTPIPTALREHLCGYDEAVIYYDDAQEIEAGALNPALDWTALEEAYVATRFLYFDQLLTDAALARLRGFLRRSTVYFNYSENGFVGSYVTDGLDCPLVMQIVRELHERLPRLLRGRPLNNMWAYRYEPSGSGVRPHNGDGSVTINFWLTQDEANLHTAGGGMVMYNKEHPPDLDWTHTNMYKDDPAVQARIAEYLEDAEATTIPYGCNRAVLFHSTLFHKTDPFEFKPGFENRRMNITMLFGRRSQEGAKLL